jgi:hypothetical protein
MQRHHLATLTIAFIILFAMPSTAPAQYAGVIAESDWSPRNTAPDGQSSFSFLAPMSSGRNGLDSPRAVESANYQASLAREAAEKALNNGRHMQEYANRQAAEAALATKSQQQSLTKSAAQQQNMRIPKLQNNTLPSKKKRAPVIRKEENGDDAPAYYSPKPSWPYSSD